MAAAMRLDRARGACVGALVADAATMPTHWLYDQVKLAALVQARPGQPEFLCPSACPFYQLPTGALSPYGAELAAVVGHLAAAPVSPPQPLSGDSVANALAHYFGSVYGGYRNHSIKTLLANVEAGKAYPETGDADDTQANCLCKLPVVTAIYAGSPQLDAAVEASVRAQQNNDASVSAALAAAKVLERVILGSSIAEALQWAQREGSLAPAAAALVREALAAQDLPFNEAAQKLGISCSMPGAFQVALLAAARATSYEDGIRTNMLAGGDNCSRSVYLGALLGAAHGAGGVPQAWKEQVEGWAELQAAVDAVVR